MQELKKTFDIPLNDIKTIVEVPEYSFYYLLVLSFLSLLIFGIIVFLAYKWLKKRNAYNQRKEYYKFLHSINLDDTKNAAYSISLYGALFKDDGDKQAGMYENISKRLEQYKYKKSVEQFDKETLEYIELYKGMIDV